MRQNVRLSARSLCVAAFLVIGCSSGDEVGRVAGVVTVDGSPLAGVHVTFQPDNGRRCQGVTDAGGNYELLYKPGESSVPVGQYRVVITTATERSPVEKLPPRYNRATELTREVKSGANELNFELDSSGK